jgi:uncharacterized protein YdaU (DUF1376 family)
MLEDAAYSRLMRIYYATERQLPCDKRALYRLVRAASKTEREAVDVVLTEFFQECADGYRQTRCDEEIARHQEQAAVNRDIGKRGGRPRKTESVSVNNRNGFEEKVAEEGGITSAMLRSGKVVALHNDDGSVKNVTKSTTVKTERVSENNPSHKPLAISHKPIEQEQDQKQGRASAPRLPDWLAESAWNDWHAFRNTRKGWTAKARELSLRTLAELHAQGHDPRKVIEQSIERGWTGLFPIRIQEARGSPRPSIAQQFAEKTYTGTPDDELPSYLRSARNDPPDVSEARRF